MNVHAVPDGAMPSRARAIALDPAINLVARFNAHNDACPQESDEAKLEAWLSDLREITRLLSICRPATMGGCVALLSLVRGEMQDWIQAAYHADILANCVDFLEAGA